MPHFLSRLLYLYWNFRRSRRQHTAPPTLYLFSFANSFTPSARSPPSMPTPDTVSLSFCKHQSLYGAENTAWVKGIEGSSAVIVKSWKGGKDGFGRVDHFLRFSRHYNATICKPQFEHFNLSYLKPLLVQVWKARTRSCFRKFHILVLSEYVVCR